MADWSKILKSIPLETSEDDLEYRFVLPLLEEELGFSRAEILGKKQFAGSIAGVAKTLKPDFSCYQVGNPSTPLLVVEDKAVKPELMQKAIAEVQEQMLVSSATFGLATNGLQIQLWQRHGTICVPRTPLQDISPDGMKAIV